MRSQQIYEIRDQLVKPAAVYPPDCYTELDSYPLAHPNEERYQHLLADIRAEFPRFRIIKKSESRFQRLIHRALVLVTAGQMRSYLSGYQTTMGSRVYVTDDWDQRSADDRYVTMRHELIHMRQFRTYTFPGMTLLYVFLPLPIGLAYFRARFEWQAYSESIRAAAELHGIDHVRSGGFREHIVDQFVGPSYGWMWPFRDSLNRWYDAVVNSIDAGEHSQ
jgi:hypothetical protein